MATKAIVIASAVVVAWSCARAPTVPQPAPQTLPPVPAIERALNAPAWPDELRAFYAAREWQPVFVGSRMAEVPTLLDTIDALVADGLPAAPGTTQARRWLTAAHDSDTVAALELLLAGLWVDAARGLSGGRVTPRQVDSLWSVEPAVADVWALLGAAERGGGFTAALTALRPAHEGYARLRAVLALELSRASPPDPALVQQLVVNLERWRWLPRQLEVPYLLVNVPAQELHSVAACGTTSLHRIVVGRPDWQTPLINSAVTHVVLAPSWRVPGEIMRREILPLIRADSGYLRRHKFLVYRGRGTRPVDPASVDWSGPDTLRVRLEQQPGPTNPLGRVKLVFANAFAVGLHDTPAAALFDAGDRALSHGCVRVESAFVLAASLLGGAAGWDVERLTAAADTWTTRWIALPRPVPVYVTYFTAWADDHGVLQRREDVYGWDARLAAALAF